MIHYAWKLSGLCGTFSKKRTDCRTLIACLISFVLSILMVASQSACFPVAMGQGKLGKFETAFPITTVAKGYRSGIREPLQTVIRNQGEWNVFWKRHSSRDTHSALAPSVDFDREMVVGIFLGEKNTGGYGVEIVRAERRDSSLYFYYREEIPPPGAIVTQALTQPFHLVKVMKYDNMQVIFRRDS